MTAYSNLEHVPAAIESVLAQDLDSFELILVDDGSEEDIESVIAPYLGQLRLIRQQNCGPGIARDAGVAAANGEYIAFCDSDDVQYPWRLSAHLSILEAHPDTALVFSDLATYESGLVTTKSTLRERQLGIDEGDFDIAIARAFGAPTSCDELGIQAPEDFARNPIYSGRVPALIAARHVAWAGASMMRKSVYQDVGGHQIRQSYMEDWHLISRISKQHDLVFWDAPVLRYRQHPGQQTRKDVKTLVRGFRDVVVDVWSNDEYLRGHHKSLLHSLLASAYLQNVHYAMEAGEYARARADIFACIRALPWKRHGYTQLIRCLWRGRVFANTSRSQRASNKRSIESGSSFWPLPAGITALVLVIAFVSLYLAPLKSLDDSSPASTTVGQSVAGDIEPVFALWDAGDIEGAFARSKKIMRDLNGEESDVRSSLAGELVRFYVGLGRIDDAEMLAAVVQENSVRLELEAVIAFSSGNRTRARELLDQDIDVTEPTTALLMVMVGLQEKASESLKNMPGLRNASQKLDMISAIGAMNDGDLDLAGSSFERAANEMDVHDEGFFYVATDMHAELARFGGDLDEAIEILEKTTPRQDVAIRNGSAIFWLMCQRKLADLYAEAGRLDDAEKIEDLIVRKLILADDSFPLARRSVGA